MSFLDVVSAPQRIPEQAAEFYAQRLGRDQDVYTFLFAGQGLTPHTQLIPPAPIRPGATTSSARYYSNAVLPWPSVKSSCLNSLCFSSRSTLPYRECPPPPSTSRPVRGSTVCFFAPIDTALSDSHPQDLNLPTYVAGALHHFALDCFLIIC
jgi:hypothetical protein